MVNKVILLILLAIFAIGVAGCQALHGLGGDIQWTGEKIQEATTQ
ncbi:MAG: hypothetical protein ABIG61_08325 [Planctomycetota bacterium]